MYHVLIVEDDLMVRLGLKNAIDWRSMNMSVVAEAVNGEAGFEKFKTYHPHIVITDIKMAKMDGYEFIKKIRQQDRDCCILVITCVEDFSLAKDLANQQIFGYLVKSTMTIPDVYDMLALIKQHLDKNIFMHGLPSHPLSAMNTEFISDAQLFFADEGSDYTAFRNKYPDRLMEKPKAALLFQLQNHDATQLSYLYDLINNEIKEYSIIPLSEYQTLVLLPVPLERGSRMPEHIRHLAMMYLNITVRLFIRNIDFKSETVAQSIKKLTLFGQAYGDEEEHGVIDTRTLDINQYLQARENRKSKINGTKNTMMQKSIRYIQNNFREDLTLNRIADHVNLSPGYFSGLFKKETGMTLTRYINQVRIDEAKKLLSNTDMFMYEIALAVGYSEFTYFSKIFKSITSVSPKEWRDHAGNNSRPHTGSGGAYENTE